MKRVIFGVLFCMTIFVALSQESQKYNSVCIFTNEESPQDFINTQIDKITYNTDNPDDISQIVWQGATQNEIPVADIDNIYFYNPYVEGVLEINESIDVWEKAYVTPIGYFCYKSTLPYESDDLDSEAYEMMSYVDFAKTRKANVVLSKELKLPVWFVVDEMYCYFDYMDNAICRVVIEDDTQTIGEIEFTYDASIIVGENEYSTDDLKRVLWILTSLLDGNTAGYEKLSTIIDQFKSILLLDKEVDGDKVSEYPQWNGAYIFTTQSYPRNFITGNIYNLVMVMTGGAYNVDATSADLDGGVRCASRQFDTAGVYGIICDENPENLTLEAAKYNAVGHQERLSLNFRTNISSLKYNTKYYYRAYYKKVGKSDLNFKHGDDIAAGVAYGEVRNFSTLSPTAVTGEATKFTTQSAVVKCSFDNISASMECGVVVSGGNKTLKFTAANPNGECEISVGGLEPATTYEYSAYVSLDGTVIASGETKSFTTALPNISGTWTCNETHQNVTGELYYETYSITLQQDGSVQTSKAGMSIVSSSWSLDASGRVGISVVYIATNTMTSGESWTGTVDDMKNPQKITGYRQNWNYGPNGYVAGEAIGIEMTR